MQSIDEKQKTKEFGKHLRTKSRRMDTFNVRMFLLSRAHCILNCEFSSFIYLFDKSANANSIDDILYIWKLENSTTNNRGTTNDKGKVNINFKKNRLFFQNIGDELIAV